MKYCKICKIKKWFEFMFGINLCKNCPYKGQKSNNNGKKG